MFSATVIKIFSSTVKIEEKDKADDNRSFGFQRESVNNAKVYCIALYLFAENHTGDTYEITLTDW